MEFESNSICKFSKSCEERYNEYCSILRLSDIETFSIRERWSIYLEASLGDSSASSGEWHACWNILRSSCEGLKISFPKRVQVRVFKVHFENLSADVSIVNTQNDDELYSIPSIIESVPVKDLYAITSPELEDLDLIAECLDQLRFFYHHLWWPWVDDEQEIDDKSVHWVSNHLRNRLELYYDKLGMKMPYVAAKKIQRLMDKCREYYDLVQNADDLDATFVHRLRKELNSMKVELNMWGIPEIRKLKNKEVEKANTEKGVLVTLQENEMLDAMTYLSHALDTLASKELTDIPTKLVSTSFEDCHLNYDANDIILMTPGNYELNYMEYFDFPVSIEGLHSPKEVVISDKRSHRSIFQFLTTSVCIENVVFNLKHSRAVLAIKRGTLVLNNVRFNNLHFMDTIAVEVPKNTKLVARGCRFSNFNTAIVCQEGAVIELDECTFENNSSCLQFVKGATITMNNCDLRSTADIPFVYDKNSAGDRTSHEESYESLDDLSRIPGITINGIQLDDETIAVENT